MNTNWGSTSILCLGSAMAYFVYRTGGVQDKTTLPRTPWSSLLIFSNISKYLSIDFSKWFRFVKKDSSLVLTEGEGLSERERDSEEGNNIDNDLPELISCDDPESLLNNYTLHLLSTTSPQKSNPKSKRKSIHRNHQLKNNSQNKAPTTTSTSDQNNNYTSTDVTMDPSTHSKPFHSSHSQDINDQINDSNDISSDLWCIEYLNLVGHETPLQTPTSSPPLTPKFHPESDLPALPQPQIPHTPEKSKNNLPPSILQSSPPSSPQKRPLNKPVSVSDHNSKPLKENNSRRVSSMGSVGSVDGSSGGSYRRVRTIPNNSQPSEDRRRSYGKPPYNNTTPNSSHNGHNIPRRSSHVPFHSANNNQEPNPSITFNNDDMTVPRVLARDRLKMISSKNIGFLY